jgi:phage terminase large subunit
MPEVNLLFTPKQTSALETMEDPNVKEVMYGGAKGGGKSVFLVQYAFIRCQQLIQLFQIKENPSFHLPVGYMGRKRGVDFTKTTLETWKKIIPAECYKIRPMDKEIIVDNKVKIYYGGMDDEASVNKMNSAEFAFIALDQAEEITKDDLGLCKGTLRLRYNGKIPKYKVLLTANPSPCFLKYEFIDSPPKDGSKVFIQALPTDNPFLDEDYVKTLQDAFKHRPELIRAYVHGSWDDIESLDLLIKTDWANNAINRTPKEEQDIRITSADVARYGHDETVVYNIIDRKIVGENISGMNSANENASKILSMAQSNRSDMIVIDGDGFGGGVVDIVRDMLKGILKPTVFEINSGRKARNEKDFTNSKAEMWFHTADLMAEGKLGIPNDHILVQDLTNIKYFTASNGRFAVESKLDVRKRTSRSPDRADALVYGMWASQFVPKKKYDYVRNDNIPVPIDRGGYDIDITTGAKASKWTY